MNTRLGLSLALAVAAYFLGIVADANHDSDSAVYPAACLTKILFFLIAVPLAASAGRRLRRESNSIGIPGLRAVSWITYFVAIGHFGLFFQWPLIAVGGDRLPDGQITVDAAMFFVAAMLMIADAWSSPEAREA